MNVSERDLATLRAILRRSFPGGGVQFYLFGSRVTGGARPDSDLDILIVSDAPVPFRVLGDVIVVWYCKFNDTHTNLH